MSADNGIYILQNRSRVGFETEFRVAHCQSIDNIYDPELGDCYIVANFGSSAVFPNARLAQTEAEKLYEEWTKGGAPVEYGIKVIEQFSDKRFPKISMAEALEKIRTAFNAPVPKPPADIPSIGDEQKNTAAAGFEQFWMVFCERPALSGAPTVKHPSFESASKEAERLSLKHKCPAYVLEAVRGFRPVDQVIPMVPTR